MVFKQFLFPVYIRVSVSFFVRGRMTILVEYRMRPVGVPRFTFDKHLAGNGLVFKEQSIELIIFFGELRCRFGGYIGADLNISFSLFSLFGGNEYNTVGSLYAEDGGCGSILKH